MIIGGPGSGKASALLNLISQQDDIDKIYLYAKDLNKPTYQSLIEKREITGTKYLNDLNLFIEHSNIMDIAQTEKDMIADIMNNKTFPAVFSRCFITQSYFSAPKDVK